MKYTAPTSVDEAANAAKSLISGGDAGDLSVYNLIWNI